MNYPSNRIYTFAGLAFLVTAAISYDYARWLCNVCYIPPASYQPASPSDFGDALSAIKAMNNEIMQSGPMRDNPAWIDKDTITVCNGSSCIDLTFQKSGQWVIKPGTIPYKDNGRGYKNARVVSVITSPAAGGSTGGVGSVGFMVFYDVYYYWLVSVHNGIVERLKNGTVTIIQPGGGGGGGNSGAGGSGTGSSGASFGSAFDNGGDSDSFVPDSWNPPGGSGGGNTCSAYKSCPPPDNY